MLMSNTFVVTRGVGEGTATTAMAAPFVRTPKLSGHQFCEKNIKERGNSRKSVRWSAVPVAPVFVYVSVMVRGAAVPKGPMTYAQ